MAMGRHSNLALEPGGASSCQNWLEGPGSQWNHIDTAQVCGTGESERICGKLVKRMKREDFVMQTKVWTLAAKPQNLIKWNTAPHVKLEECLERFGLDYIDVYMIHSQDHTQSIATIAKSLAQCAHEGLTKTVAVGNHSKDDMLQMQAELARYDIPLACNKRECNVLRPSTRLQGECHCLPSRLFARKAA